MPGHDHSLRKLYTIEGLSNPSMVYNWVCPILLKEDCPYQALARIFSTYFKDTSGINTSEDFLNFGWAAPLFSESDWSIMKHYTKRCTCKYFLCIFLSLQIVTRFSNLVLFECVQISSLLTTFTVCEYPLSLIILDTLLLTLINGNSASGITWALLKKFYIRCVFAFHGAFPQSPVPQGPSHLPPPAGQLQHRSILLMRRNSLRPQKVGVQPLAPRALGHPRL